MLWNCFGKRLKGPQYKISERRMEVDGKLFTEREETTITMDAYGNKTTQVEVTRTIARGEKTCRVIVESNEGKSESVTHKIGLTPAEAEAFQEEWSLKWNHEEAEEVHPPSSKKKHRHHRKKHHKVGIEEDNKGTTKGEPETNIEVEATAPVTQETPNEESKKEQEPELERKKRKKRRFWWLCCC